MPGPVIGRYWFLGETDIGIAKCRPRMVLDRLPDTLEIRLFDALSEALCRPSGGVRSRIPALGKKQRDL